MDINVFQAFIGAKMSPTDAVAISEAIEKSTRQTNSDLATKDFVRSEVERGKNETVRWIIGVGFALMVSVAGLYMKLG